jgi:hypothetical protein
MIKASLPLLATGFQAALACGLFTTMVSLGSCAADPKSVACNNDGECRDRGEKFNYCLENRCVECVGNSRCKRGFVCDDGFCRFAEH